MSYAVRNDGRGFRAVTGADDVLEGETFSMTEPPAVEPTPNELILGEIAALEATGTARRIREAVLGIDNGWLEALNDQLAALRGTLK